MVDASDRTPYAVGACRIDEAGITADAVVVEADLGLPVTQRRDALAAPRREARSGPQIPKVVAAREAALCAGRADDTDCVLQRDDVVAKVGAAGVRTQIQRGSLGLQDCIV